MKKQEIKELKEILDDRNIEYVMHFTNCANLKSILENGLLSREDLEYYDIDSYINDRPRHDDHLDAICASIEFPNYKMFYKLRRESPDEDWAVIILKSEILYEFECGFCSTNAACTTQSTLSKSSKTSLNAFNSMFEDFPEDDTKKKCNLKPYYTTNPQAEVLIFESIGIDYFIYVAFEDEETKRHYEKKSALIFHLK